VAGESVISLRVVDNASAALRKVDRQAGKLAGTVNKSNGKLKDQSRGLKGAAAGWLGVGTSARAATPGIVGAGAALQTALGPIALFTSAMALAAGALKVIADQDKANAALRTLGVNAEELAPKLHKVSQELKHQFSQTELTAAAYDVASAGFTNAADAAMVLKASAQAAAGGMADLNTTGDAVTTILNAWKLEAKDATQVADMMQQTVADGKIKIEQYAKNIGKVATTAAQLKIPLKQVNAAISLSTVAGVNAERALTGINAALAKIAKGDAGKALGIELNAATLESEGLYKTLKKIAEAPLGDQIKALGIEGHAAMGPVLADLDKYEKFLKNQENATGAAGEALNKQADTIGGAWTEMSTVISNLFSSQSELGKSVKYLIQVVTAGIKLIAWMLKPVFKMINDISWLVDKTIKGIQWLWEHSGGLLMKKVNPGAEEGKEGDKKGEESNKKNEDSLRRQKELVKHLEEGYKNIAVTISQSMAGALKGLIKGTQTLGEALSNIANKITDMLLDLAISSMFKSFGLPGFAAGGRPPVGEPAVVGERGPEVFVPRQAGTIVPNHELGGGGSSTNISISVDASGSSVEGDAERSRQLGELIGAAVQTEIIKQQRPGGTLYA
jgi:TP901 family phage tail tape measure protein